MIKLDANEIIDDNTILLIKHPTGIIYNVQAGGMLCIHPECEGFILSVNNFGQDLDDCSYGCCYLDENGRKSELANAIQAYCQERYSAYEIKFDFNRLSELQEGWWPVTAKIEGLQYEGYLHTRNCD